MPAPPAHLAAVPPGPSPEAFRRSDPRGGPLPVRREVRPVRNIGTRGNFYAEDVIAERGSYTGPGGGRHPYTWDQARLGQITVAVTVKSATGHPEGAFDHTVQVALAAMMLRAEKALEAA